MTTHTTDSTVSLVDDEDLRALGETVRQVCSDAGGTTLVRDLAAAGRGFDERLWRTLSEQVGIAGLGLADPAGDGGLAELAVVCEQLGAQLAPVPFLGSTVLAGQVLARCSPVAVAALEAVAAGQIHALAVADADGVWNPDRLAVRAERSAAGWVLHGMSPFVLDGAAATTFVVAARTSQGIDVFTVPASGEGVHVQETECLDLSRVQAILRLTAAPATALTEGGAGEAAVVTGLDRALVAVAAEQLGGAQTCLDRTVAYVKERTQFGRAIGSFQAVKHRCADALVRVETARSAVVRAVRADGDPEALAEAAAVAQIWCSEAFVWVAEECLQLHGGMGFTWEHDAHLYFRRALADAALLGDARHHRDRLAAALGW